jgi:prevent-host-death family protein
MRRVGIFAAKAQLSQLVQAVEDGEEVTLTRHGKPVARLVAIDDKKGAWSAMHWAGELRNYRHERDRGAAPGTTLAELIASGRR